MQQIFRQSDDQLEVYTTVLSPQVCRSRARRPDAEKAVAVRQYRSSWPEDLDLNRGDLIQVLFKKDQTWWFGRLASGGEGYFPAACVEPLQDDNSSSATPMSSRRASLPVVVMTACAPCGCTSAPRPPRRGSTCRSAGPDVTSGDHPHGSPSLLHRILAKTRRKSCPHLSNQPLDRGSINPTFKPD
ncbi:jouberin-like [Antennarius striatus]|uniref:jouberin-like n=1 Tax=Antennarius striatus TaxID=241820 RepID=UPI0035B0C225